MLIVVAIVAIVAGTLAPVLVSAKESAKRTVCFSNFHTVGLASMMYVADYDDHFMPLNHQPAAEPNSQNDRTWVQLVLPYVRSFDCFRCPSDYSVRPRLETSFDQDLVSGDTYSQYYSASLRSNVGYNYVYLSPIVRDGNAWTIETRTGSQIASPSTMLEFVDSVWSRNSSGEPVGGGSWLVGPPCRYAETQFGRRDTFQAADGNDQIYTFATGWDARQPNSPLRYGGAWPWHSGRITIAHIDGSVMAMTPSQLSAGCEVKPDWKGLIVNEAIYPWVSD